MAVKCDGFGPERKYSPYIWSPTNGPQNVWSPEQIVPKYFLNNHLFKEKERALQTVKVLESTVIFSVKKLYLVSLFLTVLLFQLTKCETKANHPKNALIGHVVIGNLSILFLISVEPFHSVGFPANLNIG